MYVTCPKASMSLRIMMCCVVPASDMIFTFHCIGGIPSGPSSSSLSPVVICSTPQPGPQTLYPRSQRRPVSAPETASPLGRTSAQTLASLWKGDMAGKCKSGWLFSKSISHIVAPVIGFAGRNKTHEKQYAVLQLLSLLCPLENSSDPTTPVEIYNE